MAEIVRPQSPHFQQTLDHIYDAAFDREAFVNLAPLLATAMQAANGILIVAENGIPVDQSATTSSDAQKDYFAYYGGIDVWTPPTFEAPSFSIVRSQERITDDRVLNSEFYCDYARHLDMWHPMGAACSLARDRTLIVGVNRTRTSPGFNQDEEERLIELFRHVQRALQMRGHFQHSESRAQAGFAALDVLAFAAIVVDAAGLVAFANAEAETFNREGAGLTLRGGRIGCAIQRQAREFEALIRTAASGGSGGAMRLSDSSGGTALLALVAPMPNRLRESQSGGEGLALVAIRREKDNPGFAEAIISQLFGLSRSEAQVACALLGGATLDEIATQRGVKITTIKTQIEAAFRKTGTENQRDLVRLIGKLPQLI